MGSVTWHSSGGPARSESSEVASCFVGRAPALCGRTAFGWWSVHSGYREMGGGVLLLEVTNTRCADPE